MKKAITIGVMSLLVVGLVTAGLLNYFGQLTTTATVSQAITVDGDLSAVVVPGSETRYSNEANVVSHTINDLDVKFTNECNAIDEGGLEIDCGGVTTTNMVELGVIGYTSSDPGYDADVTPWESDHYKALDYMDEVSLDVLDIVYSFKILDITGGYGDTLSPYIVIVGEGLGDYNVAVQMVPDGGTYAVGEEYTKTLGGATFHVPGSSECTQQSPCDITALQAEFSPVEVERVRLAFGAWPGEGSIDILMGIDTISGEQTGYMKMKVYGETTVPTIQKYDFVSNIVTGEYTITTTVDIVGEE